MTYPCYLDEDGAWQKGAGIDGIPMFFIVSRDGKLVHEYRGKLKEGSGPYQAMAGAMRHQCRPSRAMISRRHVIALTAPLFAAACGPAAPPPPAPTINIVLPPALPAPPAPPAPADEPEACQPMSPPHGWSGEPVAEVPTNPDDPRHGHFTLEDATRGLTGAGPLIARISTDRGELRCELWPDRAPIAVANFVGLARGLRPWKAPDGGWRAVPAYDGTTFHRIVKGFMIQGGDPKGNGTGEAGYVIPDEIWTGALHDRRGLLCTANRGKNTNGIQFFVLDAPAPHLDGGHPIIGQCGPDEVIEAIAGAPVKGSTSAPIDPPRIRHVRIQRADPDAPCAR